jgi:glycosyltransferase involved in cell wall biosynthesis
MCPTNESEGFIELWPGKGKPEISILMPLFEQSKYVAQSLRSVLGQKRVVAEIIISDDASNDDTYAIALRVVQDWISTHNPDHKILLRRGSERLWRDHLPLLVEQATCNIVCQAHGDDISIPDRAHVLVNVFKALPKTTLVASEAVLINQDNVLLNQQRPVGTEVSLSKINYEDIVSCKHPYLIGFSQAWRRDALTLFPRLDRNFAAVAHDRILPFRASLVGDVYLIKSQLVMRRDHADAARHLMFDEPDTNGKFGWRLTRIAAKTAMRQDLNLAYKLGKVSKQRFLQTLNLISKLMGADISVLLEAYRQQTYANRQIAWVNHTTLKELRSQHLVANAKKLTSIHVFIISWTGKHDNSAAIAKSLVGQVDFLTVIYSDENDQLVPDFPCQSIRTPNHWYWGMKFRSCLDACESDLMLVIHGDCTCDDWSFLIRKCQSGFASSERIGIWAPLIDYTPFDLNKTLIDKLALSNLNIVAQTDMIVFALNSSVISRLKLLNYEDNKYGWGIGWAALAFTYANQLVAVVDEELKVIHPKERGYDSRNAKKQMDVFLGQLTVDERLQYRLLDAYTSNK